MEPTSFWAKIMEYGLAGVVIGILFWLIIKILIWVMAWVDKQSLQHLQEREDWLVILESIKTSLDLHNQSSIESRKQQAEGHEYQRTEHKEIILNQGKISNCLSEVEKSLGRINGYVR